MVGGHRDKNREDTQKRVSSLIFCRQLFSLPLEGKGDRVAVDEVEKNT